MSFLVFRHMKLTLKSHWFKCLAMEEDRGDKKKQVNEMLQIIRDHDLDSKQRQKYSSRIRKPEEATASVSNTFAVPKGQPWKQALNVKTHMWF